MNTLAFDLNHKLRSKNNYCDLPTISIDPKCAYEIDDSISLEKTLNGIPDFITEIRKVRDLKSKLDDLVKAKGEYFESNSSEVKQKASFKSEKLFVEFKLLYHQLVEKNSFLQGFEYPVDHFFLGKV